jgi:hypothetical protein
MKEVAYYSFYRATWSTPYYLKLQFINGDLAEIRVGSLAWLSKSKKDYEFRVSYLDHYGNPKRRSFSSPLSKYQIKFKVK